DAYPDPHWLHYLAASFVNPANAKHAAVGGPNIAPPTDGPIAECVSHSPCGPICASNVATEKPKRYWRKDGRRSITSPATLNGPGGFMEFPISAGGRG